MAKFVRRVTFAIALVLVLTVLPESGTVAQRLPVPVSPTLQARVAEQGYIPVLVRLDTAYTLETRMTQVDAKAQRKRLTAIRRDLVQSLGEHAVLRSQSDKWMIPYVALWVDERGLRKLENTPGVAEIIEDVPAFPSLTSVLGPTDTFEAHNLGFVGLDQVVAVVDSGINKNHPMLAEVLAGEACFSQPFTSIGLTSLCPNNSAEQTGSGSANSSKCNGIDQCNHGSYMTGIVAGAPFTIPGDGTYKGIGFGSKVLAVQVYVRSSNAAYCAGQPSTPCIATLIGDQIAGLQHIYNTRGNYNLAAVVLGFTEAVLGGTPGACDSDPRRDLIRALYDVGIPTIVPAGNLGNTEKVGPPACITEAIAVGATDDSKAMASFSNSSNLIDLLAIGLDVNSAVGDIGIGDDDGTSAAAAMVAGAWAVLKQVRPNAEVNVILDALQTTGVNVLDVRNGLTHKFIQVGEAVKLLQTLAPATNLITNPGFETGSGNIATSWTQSGTGASRICNPTDPKLVRSGSCAAQLVSNGSKSQFKQTIVQAATSANYAWMSAYINTQNAAGKIQAKFIGGDGSTLKIKLPVSGSGTYRLLSNTVSLKNQTYTITIKMKINTTGGGKYEVDDLFLSYQDTGASIP